MADIRPMVYALAVPRDLKLRQIMLVAGAAAVFSIWIVAQDYVGEYVPGFGLWFPRLALAGAVAIASALAVQAVKGQRFPWIEALLSAAIYYLTYYGWRVVTSYDDDLFYKIVWEWIGNATPLVALATWAVAATLGLELVKRHREPIDKSTIHSKRTSSLMGWHGHSAQERGGELPGRTCG